MAINKELIEALRSPENKSEDNDGTALEVIEQLLNEDTSTISMDESEFLQQQLFEIALHPLLFEHATLALGKIYSQEPDAEEEVTQNYKALFKVDNKVIDLAAKQQVLQKLIALELEEARSLVFHILEEILPTSDKKFNQFVLNLLAAMMSLETQRIHDMMLVTLEDYIKIEQWDINLQNFIQTLVASVCELVDEDDEDEKEQYESELSFYAQEASKHIPENLLDQAFQYCKEIMNGGMRPPTFAITFLRAIYPRFPERFATAFKDCALLLTDLDLLISLIASNTNAGPAISYQWSLIGMFLLNNYATDAEIIEKIAEEIKILEPKNIHSLTKILIDDTTYPANITQWAQTVSADCDAPVKKRKLNGKTTSNPTDEAQKSPPKIPATLLTGWTSYYSTDTYSAQCNGQLLNFRERIVRGDGNCAFYASGFDRINLFSTLLEKINDDNLRRKFVEEIQEYYTNFYTIYLGTPAFAQLLEMNPIMMQIHSHMQAQGVMDELQRKIGDANPQLRENKKNLLTHFDEFPNSKDKNDWVEISEAYQKSDIELKARLNSPEMFQTYMAHSATNNEWCSNVALIEYARIKGIDLVIWKKENRTENKLIIEASHGDIHAANAIHLHFKYVHYDRLDPVATANSSASPTSMMVYK